MGQGITHHYPQTISRSARQQLLSTSLKENVLRKRAQRGLWKLARYSTNVLYLWSKRIRDQELTCSCSAQGMNPHGCAFWIGNSHPCSVAPCTVQLTFFLPFSEKVLSGPERDKVKFQSFIYLFPK